jgi:hypothetical protein
LARVGGGVESGRGEAEHGRVLASTRQGAGFIVSVERARSGTRSKRWKRGISTRAAKRWEPEKATTRMRDG